ncbi:crossover junction endonuclease MUS81 [Pseudomyrmex gracilis]|uniref:crossover junction endonuclease MUS81 n=1 Tax=Pseudomyrmex gracilis TaxID=219809 RepID=UPI00099541D7|nr:crossover junction endonuclease MUS81 [Pseudomyrmex gracilis]
MKRVKVVPDRPNRLFETWLEEWENEAARRKSELRYHFAKALSSLRKYPLPLESGRECIILQHFGTKLCSMLDKKLEEYKKQSSKVVVTSGSSANEDYTSTLIQKQVDENRIVEEKTTLAKQARTAKKNASKQLVNNTNQIATQNDRVEIVLEPGTFDIILLVDTQETCGGKTKPQHDKTLAELEKFDLLFEVRRLKVGDFGWIAKCRKTSYELVLPYIVERKRMDDLSASIIDGRFHEQKFRLKQSGIQHLMYIVENTDKNTRFSIPLSSLLQASVNCLIQDGFTVKHTKSHKDSMLYLSYVTKTIIKSFKNKRLVGCKKDENPSQIISFTTIPLMEFKEFNKASSKQRTFKVSEMFIRQLVQLKGMSVDKAMAIVERYATPRNLVTALKNNGRNGEQLLANIQFGDKKRQLGPTISKTVYQFYTMMNLS